MIVTLIQASVNLLRPEWVRFRLAVRVVCSTVVAGVSIALLTAGRWVEFVDSKFLATAKKESIQAAQTALYYTFLSILIVMFAIAIGQIAADVLGLIRRSRLRPSPPALTIATK
jgi:hypothetical protein